jgi:hypothetical protein
MPQCQGTIDRTYMLGRDEKAMKTRAVVVISIFFFFFIILIFFFSLAID